MSPSWRACRNPPCRAVSRQLGYHPNALARGLILQRTNIVAVLISSLTNLHYPEVLEELTRELTAHDMRVLLFSLRSESEVDAVLDQVWRHNVDGVICAARLSDRQIDLFTTRHVPLVLYNRTPLDAKVASVGCDSASGERELVERLLAAGHRAFGIIGGPEDSYVGEERSRAALARLHEEGFEDVPVARGDFGYQGGAAAFGQLRETVRSLDAVICANDIMAIGAIDAARATFGLAIPGDVSIVGFDGTDAASWASYRVTSMRQPVHRMTLAAVAMLREQIDNEDLPAERRLFSAEFVPGASARLAPV